MGAAPSREVLCTAPFRTPHGGPRQIALIPFTEEFFPTSDCLLFQQLYEAHMDPSVRYYARTENSDMRQDIIPPVSHTREELFEMYRSSVARMPLFETNARMRDAVLRAGEGTLKDDVDIMPVPCAVVFLYEGVNHVPEECMHLGGKYAGMFVKVIGAVGDASSVFSTAGLRRGVFHIAMFITKSAGDYNMGRVVMLSAYTYYHQCVEVVGLPEPPLMPIVFLHVKTNIPFLCVIRELRDRAEGSLVMPERPSMWLEDDCLRGYISQRFARHICQALATSFLLHIEAKLGALAAKQLRRQGKLSASQAALGAISAAAATSSSATGAVAAAAAAAAARPNTVGPRSRTKVTYVVRGYITAKEATLVADSAEANEVYVSCCESTVRVVRPIPGVDPATLTKGVSARPSKGCVPAGASSGKEGEHCARGGGDEEEEEKGMTAATTRDAVVDEEGQEHALEVVYTMRVHVGHILCYFSPVDGDIAAGESCGGRGGVETGAEGGLGSDPTAVCASSGTCVVTTSEDGEGVSCAEGGLDGGRGVAVRRLMYEEDGLPRPGGCWRVNRRVVIENVLLSLVRDECSNARQADVDDPRWVRAEGADGPLHDGGFHIWRFTRGVEVFYYGIVPKFASNNKRRTRGDGEEEGEEEGVERSASAAVKSLTSTSGRQSITTATAGVGSATKRRKTQQRLNQYQLHPPPSPVAGPPPLPPQLPPSYAHAAAASAAGLLSTSSIHHSAGLTSSSAATSSVFSQAQPFLPAGMYPGFIPVTAAGGGGSSGFYSVAAPSPSLHFPTTATATTQGGSGAATMASFPGMSSVLGQSAAMFTSPMQPQFNPHVLLPSYPSSYAAFVPPSQTAATAGTSTPSSTAADLAPQPTFASFGMLPHQVLQQPQPQHQQQQQQPLPSLSQSLYDQGASIGHPSSLFSGGGGGVGVSGEYVAEKGANRSRSGGSDDDADGNDDADDAVVDATLDQCVSAFQEINKRYRRRGSDTADRGHTSSGSKRGERERGGGGLSGASIERPSSRKPEASTSSPAQQQQQQLQQQQQHFLQYDALMSNPLALPQQQLTGVTSPPPPQSQGASSSSSSFMPQVSMLPPQMQLQPSPDGGVHYFIMNGQLHAVQMPPPPQQQQQSQQQQQQQQQQQSQALMAAAGSWPSWPGTSPANPSTGSTTANTNTNTNTAAVFSLQNTLSSSSGWNAGTGEMVTNPPASSPAALLFQEQQQQQQHYLHQLLQLQGTGGAAAAATRGAPQPPLPLTATTTTTRNASWSRYAHTVNGEVKVTPPHAPSLRLPLHHWNGGRRPPHD